MAERIAAWPAVGSPVRASENDAPSRTRRGEPLRARLRRDTRTAHERLDACFAALGHGDPGTYALFLQVNEACLREIEPVLAASPLARSAGTWRFEPRHREAAADLAELRAEPLALPRFALREPVLAQAVGIAYVLEGSRLGGRMILKALRRAGNGDTGFKGPMSFLETAEHADRFRMFLDLAEGVVPAGPGCDAAVAAADATFDYFLQAARIATGRHEPDGAN